MTDGGYFGAGAVSAWLADQPMAVELSTVRKISLDSCAALAPNHL
jgi:hypothetical protein